MSKIIMSAAFAFTSAVLIASTDAKSKATDTESAETKTARVEAILKKTGGFVKRKSEGKIYFINCQSRISDDEIKKRVERIQFVLKYPCEITKGKWAFGDFKPKEAIIAIYLVDDEKLPMSLVAAEAGWGIVNTSTLSHQKNRFSKQLTRVFCLTAGAANSPVKTSPMQTVTKDTDLDKLLTDGFTFDMASSINENLQALGMAQERNVPYIKACKEGWAPAPTNEYQKAIWEQVKADKERGPSNPLKIPLPKKK